MPVSLVLGASGAVGRFLVPRLLADGHRVIALSRESRSSIDTRLHWVRGDLGGALPALPAVDAIFSCGPLDLAAQWFAGGAPAARIMAIGSMSAVTKRDSRDARERALAARLQGAEQCLIDAAEARGCAWTLLRPTLIYGAGIDRSLTPLARFGLRWHVLPRVAAAGGLRQPVHAQDLAAACLQVFADPACAGRIYALGGGEQLAFATLLERIRRSLPTFVLPVPAALPLLRVLARFGTRIGLPAAGAGVLDRLAEDLVVDDSAARAAFGWSPRGFHPDAATWKPVPLPR